MQKSKSVDWFSHIWGVLILTNITTNNQIAKQLAGYHFVILNLFSLEKVRTPTWFHSNPIGWHHNLSNTFPILTSLHWSPLTCFYLLAWDISLLLLRQTRDFVQSSIFIVWGTGNNHGASSLVWTCLSSSDIWVEEEKITYFYQISGIFGSLCTRKKQWHFQELWINARLVKRLFTLLICCPLKDYLIINPASNAATAKGFSRYLYFCDLLSPCLHF